MNYEELREAVAGGAVGLRVTQRLQPAEGKGGKVFPPTYAVPAAAQHKYAMERRVIGGEEVDCVLLDSVASQANWMELALLDAWETGRIGLVVAAVDFSGEEALEDLGRITALEAPHRIADAIFRDSLLDGTLFRLSDVGRAVTDASPANASALYTYHPTGLLFGMWDSTGPKGGLGAKFQRAIVSEIVGVRAVPGVKVGSRIDPLRIEKQVTVYKAAEPEEEWTLDPARAEVAKGKPVPFDRKGASGTPGAPSKVNHGNVTPGIDAAAGGVTVDHALQTVVLSFAALRKLRFVHGSDGRPLPAERRRDAETAARTAIAALGIAAIAYQHQRDLDLRSRCLLVPEEPRRVELLTRDGAPPAPVALDVDAVPALLGEAVTAAADLGLRWHTDELLLQPTAKLCELVRRSRSLLETESAEEAAEEAST